MSFIALRVGAPSSRPAKASASRRGRRAGQAPAAAQAAWPSAWRCSSSRRSRFVRGSGANQPGFGTLARAGPPAAPPLTAGPAQTGS
eukprot:scaffold690_cov124-Isochrysis_galbana.AAC.2